MAPPRKPENEKMRDTGRFCYPPELEEKVRALAASRRLSVVVVDAIRRAPWPGEE